MEPKKLTLDPKPLDPFSPLYCRLNGFMCGTALLIAGIAQDNLYYHRIERINSFLSEVQIPLQLPVKKATLDKELKNAMQVIGDQLALKAQELGDFYALALFMLNLPEDETNLNTQIVKELDRIQRQYELPEKAFEEFRRARNQARDQRGLAALLNPAMELLRRLIDPLDLESEFIRLLKGPIRLNLPSNKRYTGTVL